MPRREHFRFVAPDKKVGKWRLRFATALTDAVAHYLTPDEQNGQISVRVTVDATVALARLSEIKEQGYRFERVLK